MSTIKGNIEGNINAHNLTVNNTTILNETTTINKTLSVTDTTNSSSKITGAVKIAGGLGVEKDVHFGKNLNIGGNLNIKGNINHINSTQINVADKTIILASNSTDDTISEDGGIVLKGTNDHSILWTSYRHPHLQNTNGTWISTEKYKTTKYGS